jgi:Sigma 54 modulation protein / S30EA ribosomal protein
LFIQISTDNHIKSDAAANARLEAQVRRKLKKFDERLRRVEVHIADMNGGKGGAGDKRVSIEARPAGHEPIAVHADAARIENAVLLAADKAARALDRSLGKQHR